VSEPARFDPYELLGALERSGVYFIVIGGFARVVHGSAEQTDGLDIVPSMREENLRRLERAFDKLDIGPVEIGDEPVTVQTRAGELRVVPAPWGTRGYDDMRHRGNKEPLGRGIRPHVASPVDLVRSLEASPRPEDQERLQRLRRVMELERQLHRHRGLGIER
jgi:hypothetical protein